MTLQVVYTPYSIVSVFVPTLLTLPEHLSSSPTCGAESTYPSRAPEFIPYMWSRKYLPFHRNNNSRFKTKVYSNHITEITTTDLKRKYIKKRFEYRSRKYLPFQST
jgi:hypothetical protein